MLEEYVDQSKSPSDKTKVRPAYDRMVADHAAGKFDAVVCWDLDRPQLQAVVREHRYAAWRAALSSVVGI